MFSIFLNDRSVARRRRGQYYSDSWYALVWCEAYDRADAMVDRWLSLGVATATLSLAYIENWTCENNTVSAYLMGYLPE